MKISIITWDADFRDNLHLIEYFANQDFDENEYEFIWVDYYHSNVRVKKEIDKFKNFKLIELENPKTKNWHLGKCINKGCDSSNGDVLVLCDGDIAVEEDFLSHIWNEHKDNKNLSLYFQRFEELEKLHNEKSSKDIKILKKNCILKSVNNNGGCLSIRKENFMYVGGYETHSVFEKQGMVNKELYIRLKNAGFDIRWEKDKYIYHPWHPNTLGSGRDSVEKKNINVFKWARAIYPWINPAQTEQSWVIYKRDYDLIYKADEANCNKYLENIPKINTDIFKKIHDLKLFE